MARLVLVTGGSRSGKSAYAQRLAESLPAPRAFVATCPVLDDEMRERVARHRQARAAARWRTVEETLDLAGAIRSAVDCQVVLVDCLTLWINNLMYQADCAGTTLTEDAIPGHCGDVLDACRAHPGTVILVTNEVGWGIIPANAASRLFRDLVGRCNQTVAAAADVVTLLVSGVPMHLKGDT